MDSLGQGDWIHDQVPWRWAPVLELGEAWSEVSRSCSLVTLYSLWSQAETQPSSTWEPGSLQTWEKEAPCFDPEVKGSEQPIAF